jgi:hypothetical protein
MAQDDPARGAPTPISFNRLGPFYRLQRRLGLLSDTDLAAGRRALFFVALAWLPTVLLAAMQGVAVDANHEHAVLFDFSAYAFAIAIGAFVLMEQTSDRRMAVLVGQFTARGIARESAREGLARARRNMERRTGSSLAEAVIAVGAYALSFAWILRAVQAVPEGAWFGRMDGASVELTLAGWWIVLVAMPLYWFLFGRWLWRFGTWGFMLYDLSRCDLRLVATHPDRCGGLAFIGQYPKTYTLFVFAESTVVSATVLKLVVHGGASLMSFKFALFGMIAFFALAFVLPLFVFTPLLTKLKREGLSHYGSLASQHNLAFEAKWVRGAVGETGEALLGAPDASSLADLAVGYELVKSMQSAPVTKESIAPIVLAALAPLVCVAATQAPFKQIIGVAKGFLLL